MGFNVGFALFNNDFTKIHNMSLIEDYVQFEALFSETKWEGEKGEERNIYETKLTLNPCNQDDFSPPYNPAIDETMAYLNQFVMCLPNSKNITLYGDYN